MIDQFIQSCDLIHEDVVIVDGSDYYRNTLADQPRYTGIVLPSGNRNWVLAEEDEDEVCLSCDREECVCDRERE